MKVAIMFRNYGPYHIARVRSAYQFLRSKGHELSAIEISQKSKTYKWDVCEEKTEFERITVFPELDYFEIKPAVLKLELQKTLTELNPDVLVVNGYSFLESRIAIKWAKENKKNIVISSESNHWDAARNPIKEYIKKRIVNLCDSAFVGGDDAREYMSNLGMPEERISLGYDAIDNEYFANEAAKRRQTDIDRDKLGLSTKPFFLLSNRFIKRKNLSGFLTAYQKYREVVKGNSWDLVLLGDGEEKNSLLKQVDTDDIEGVIFPGFRQIDELPSYYALASCFVHPALQEQWGLVVNEAMASGLPILATKHAGCTRNLVQDEENGYVFDPYSIEAMTDSLIRMHQLSDEQRAAMGNKSIEIIANWGADRFAHGLCDAVISANSQVSKKVSLLDKLTMKFLA